MAKCKPVFSLMKMEKDLGHTIDSLPPLVDSAKPLYSDFRPVVNDIHARTKREYDEFLRTKYSGKRSLTVGEPLGVVRTIESGEDKIAITKLSLVGFYNFSVDIHYGFGFDMQFHATETEVSRINSVAKLQTRIEHNAAPQSSTLAFLDLPREIREKIYRFAIPRGYWESQGDDFNRDRFLGGIGDPTGFYFPLSKDLGVIQVSKQMREEALPIAYRKTTFELVDLDELTRLLMAVGRIGRANIESLQFPWHSNTDLEKKWEDPIHTGENLKLPRLHVSKTVLILQQCKRPLELSLMMDYDMLENVEPGDFMGDPGIQGLCSLSGVKKIVISYFGVELLDDHHLVKWLKGRITET